MTAGLQRFLARLNCGVPKKKIVRNRLLFIYCQLYAICDRSRIICIHLKNKTMNPELINYLRIPISVVALAFAVWQYWQRRKIKKIIALEAIELHKNIAAALGATQAAKVAIANNAPPANEIGRAEGLSQAVLVESAKLFCNLRNTTLDDIDEMINDDQIQEQYRDIFNAFSNHKRGYIRRVIKYIRKVY